MDRHDVQELSERIDVLLDEVQRRADPKLAAQVEELVRAVLTLHGAGLGQLLSLLDELGKEKLANVIFAAVALVLLSKMGREGSTARGGDMKEMLDSIRGWMRSKLGRQKPIIEPERAAV